MPQSRTGNIYRRQVFCFDGCESIGGEIYTFVLAMVCAISAIVLLVAYVCLDGHRPTLPLPDVFQKFVIAAILVTSLFAEQLLNDGFRLVARAAMNSLPIEERKHDETPREHLKRSSCRGYKIIMLAEEMVYPKYRWTGERESERLMKGRICVKLMLKSLFLAFAAAEIQLFLNTVEMTPHFASASHDLKQTTSAFGGKCGNSTYQVIGRQLLANRTSCIDHWIKYGKALDSGACGNKISYTTYDALVRSNKTFHGSVRTPTLPLIGSYAVRNCEELKICGKSIGKLVVSRNVMAETLFTASVETFGNVTEGLPDEAFDPPEVNLCANPTVDGTGVRCTHKMQFAISGTHNGSGYRWDIITATRVTLAEVTYQAVPSGMEITEIKPGSSVNLKLPERLLPDKLQDDFGPTIQNMICNPFAFLFRDVCGKFNQGAQKEAVSAMLAAIHVRSAHNFGPGRAVGDEPSPEESSTGHVVAWQVKKKNNFVIVLALIVNLVSLAIYFTGFILRTKNKSEVTISGDLVQLISMLMPLVQNMGQPCAGSDQFIAGPEKSLFTDTYAVGIQADGNGEPDEFSKDGLNMVHLVVAQDNVLPVRSLLQSSRGKVYFGCDKKQKKQD